MTVSASLFPRLLASVLLALTLPSIVPFNGGGSSSGESQPHLGVIGIGSGIVVSAHAVGGSQRVATVDNLQASGHAQISARQAQSIDMIASASAGGAAAAPPADAQAIAEATAQLAQASVSAPGLGNSGPVIAAFGSEGQQGSQASQPVISSADSDLREVPDGMLQDIAY